MVASASRRPRASTTTASVIGSRTNTTGLTSISASRMFRGPSSPPAAIAKIGIFCRAAASTARKRVFARVGPSVGRQDHARHRLAAMRRQHAVQGVAQGETGTIRLDRRRACASRADGRRAGLGGRFQVVNKELAAAAQSLETRAEDRLDQVEPRRLPQPLDGRPARRWTPASRPRRSDRARLVGVRVGKLHALASRRAPAAGATARSRDGSRPAPARPAWPRRPAT